MSQADFVLLGQLAEYQKRHPGRPGLYSSELADRLGISRPAVSRQIQTLERRGWLARSTDPRCKRNVHLSITPAGHDAMDRQKQVLDEFFHRVFDRVGEQRMREIVTGIAELTEAMEQEMRLTQKGEHS